MNFVEKCPRCGGQVVEKTVREVLGKGVDTAFINVNAGICLHCGEKMYSPDIIRKFEEIEKKLECHETSEFQPIGQSFEVL